MSELLIIKGIGNRLSKQQIEFNKLIAAIGKRKKDLHELQEKFKKMVGLCDEKIQPVRGELSAVDLKLIELIDGHFENGKLKKKEREKTAQMILNIARQVTDPEYLDKLSPLVSKYISFQRKDLSEDEKMLAGDMLKNMFSSAFGIDIDDGELDFNDPAQMENIFKRKVAEQANEQRKENFSNSKHKSYNGKNSKLAETAELLRKSWKMLYTRLVKKLHPDAEQNEDIKAVKTEQLKKVTVAFEHNDFLTLLNFYQQEIGFTKDDAATEHLQDKNVLANYISILKKQHYSLLEKINEIKWDAMQRNLGFITQKNAWELLDKFISDELFNLSAQIKSTKADLKAFADIAVYKKILASIHMDELFGEEDDFLFDDDIDEDFLNDFLFETGKKKKSKKK
jgi:hypothetical protein